jgi:hypothetical protein
MGWSNEITLGMYKLIDLFQLVMDVGKSMRHKCMWHRKGHLQCLHLSKHDKYNTYIIVPWQWANNDKRWTILFKDQMFSSNLVLFNLQLALFSAIKLCIFQTLLVDPFVLDPSGIIFEVRKDTTFQNIFLKKL